METIIRLKHLEKLNLSGTKVEDAGLQRLSASKSITNLNLDATAITDKGVEHLAKMQSLQVLPMDDCINLTRECLNSLGKLPNLKDLYLVNSAKLSSYDIEMFQRVHHVKMYCF